MTGLVPIDMGTGIFAPILSPLVGNRPGVAKRRRSLGVKSTSTPYNGPARDKQLSFV